MTGRTIAHYTVAAPLGAGGMGEVFRARDTRLQREVAIKFLPAEFGASPERLRRFDQETKTLAALNHPNILTIHDAGVHDSSPYLVSELLEGRTLREEIGQKPVPLRKAIDLALQIAQGLAAAHAAGIIHRDLKPENLFVTKDGRIKILDFGLAKLSETPRGALDDSAHPTLANSTVPGQILGTPSYMSPEQVRGEPADHRADLFAFGCVLYEMLTGARAFRRATAVESMNAILAEQPPDPISCNPQISPAVGRVVIRCLEKHPDLRFQSVRDLAFALDVASNSTQKIASPPAAARGIFAGPRIALAASLLALAFLLGFLFGSRARSPVRAAAVPSIRYLTYSGRDYSPSASPDGKRVCFSSDRTGEKRIWIKEIATGAESPLTGGSDDFPRFSRDGSSILFTRYAGERRSLYRIPAIGGEPSKIMDDAQFGEWSPDGRQIAFVRWPGGGGSILGLADVDGGAEKILHRMQLRCSAPRWSPDGQHIALAVNDRGLPQSMAIVDLQSGQLRALPAAHPYNLLSAPAWDRSGSKLFWVQAESSSGNSVGSTSALYAQEIRSGAVRKLLWSPIHARNVDPLPSGNLLLDSRSSRQNLKEIDLGPSPAPPRTLTLGNSTDRQPCYSPEGREIVFSSNRNGNLDIWSLSSASGVLRRLTDHPADDWDPGFSPDGKYLIWSSARSGNLEVWMAQADGSSPRQVTRDGFAAENPVMTPDGHWIVYASNKPESVGVWKIHPDGSGATPLVRGATVGNPEISPDGKYVAFIDNQRVSLVSIKVVEIESGQLVPFEIHLAMQRETTVFLGRTRWMPDGRALVFVGQSADGAMGLFIQDFKPGQDTSASRRQLAGFDPQNSTESFGISPDGRHVTIAAWEQFFSIMITEDLPL